MKTTSLKNFIKVHSWTLRIGLLTAGAIILFQVISLFVIYRYLKLDYYLSLVAVCGLVTGWLLNKRSSQAEPLPISSEVEVPKEDWLAVLTSKEVLVLRLLAEGKTNKEIAAAQFIELST